MWKDIEFISGIIRNSFNKSDILYKLGLKNHGGNFNTLTRFIKKNKIDTSHFDYRKSIKQKSLLTYKSIDELLTKDSYVKSTNLKNKLYKEGLKERKCELCGQGEEWRGKKISLILDHINGNRYDNNLQNIRIVCPNCNTTLDTHCRGNRISKTQYDLCICGDKKQRKSKLCKNCYDNKRLIFRKYKEENKQAIIKQIKRKVTRPPYEILLQEVKKFGYRGTGRKYNVSDNSIRKWVKMYDKHGVNY